MEKITVAVGSTRRPKLSAVSEAMQTIGRLLSPGAQFEIAGFDVQSGVGHTPLTREELMHGAQQRSEALLPMVRGRRMHCCYFVGLEGGLEVIKANVGSEHAERRVFLESWAYVSDGVRGHYGCSGSVELPSQLAHEVVDNGVELGVAIDRFAGAVGIRDAQGAWGVLSRNLISRQEAFRLAVIAAFAPFYNAQMYHAGARAV